MKPYTVWLWAPLMALQFLTRIPVRGIPDAVFDEPGARSKALVFYPAVGVVVGAIGAATLLITRWAGLPALACAVLAVAATAIVTGAFHEDGLADTADGLGPHNREDALHVMRDSRIGTFGAVALWTVLSLKAIALGGLPTHLVIKTVIAAHVLARWSPFLLSKALPYAQPGEGLGAKMAAAINGTAVVLGTVVALAVVAPLLGPLVAGRLLVVAVSVSVLTGLFYHTRFGGVTGDCLGATNQIVEVVCLFAALR